MKPIGQKLLPSKGVGLSPGVDVSENDSALLPRVEKNENVVGTNAWWSGVTSSQTR
jgi:hypothetical protein